MKNFRQVENFEEYIELFKQTHNGWCSDEKTMKKWFKETVYLITKDDYLLTFDTKLDIDKTLWFDDEYEIPEKSEELFISYNLKNIRYDFKDYLKAQKDLKEHGCCSASDSNMFLTRCVGPLARINTAGWQMEQSDFIRELEDDEINEIIEFTNELKEQYIERLKKYYKRYNKNVFVSGYWANR